MKSWKADWLLLMSAIIWGGGFLAGKDAVGSMGPLSFSAWRFLFAALLLIVWFGRKALPTSPKEWLAGSILGTTLGLGYGFQTIGLVHLTVGKTGFLTGLAILFVPLMESVMLRRWIARPVLFGVLTSTAGLGFLCLNQRLQLEWYDLWLIATAILFSFQVIAVTTFGRQYSTASLTTIQLLLAGAINMTLACFFEDPLQGFQNNVVMDLLYTGILGTALTFVIQLKAQPYTTPTRAALLMAMESPFAALLGWIFRGERLTTRELIGCGLLTLGILVVEWKKGERNPRSIIDGPAA